MEEFAFRHELEKRELARLRDEISDQLGFRWSGTHSDYSLQIHWYAKYLGVTDELRHLGASAYSLDDPDVTIHCIQSVIGEPVFELTLMNSSQKIYRHTLLQCGTFLSHG
jgi:hypothetical protein